MIPRLKEIYNKEIQPGLKDKFGFKKYFYGTQKLKKLY